MPERRARAPTSFSGVGPASQRASANARASSSKRDTKCELVLRRALWAAGLRYRLDVAGLPGRPDVVFRSAKVAVFVDGDFWHGRNLEDRIRRLQRGHNAPYWVAKIRGNVERDRRNTFALENAGWEVLRFWETDLLKDAGAAATAVLAAVRSRREQL